MSCTCRYNLYKTHGVVPLKNMLRLLKELSLHHTVICSMYLPGKIKADAGTAHSKRVEAEHRCNDETDGHIVVVVVCRFPLEILRSLHRLRWNSHRSLQNINACMYCTRVSSYINMGALAVHNIILRLNHTVPSLVIVGTWGLWVWPHSSLGTYHCVWGW